MSVESSGGASAKIVISATSDGTAIHAGSAREEISATR